MLSLIDRFSSWVLLILKAPGAIQWGWNLPGRWLRSEIIFRWLPLRRLRRSRLGMSLHLWRLLLPGSEAGNPSLQACCQLKKQELRSGRSTPSTVPASEPCLCKCTLFFLACVLFLAYFLLSFLLWAALSFFIFQVKF
jgi:hypothetical protein